MTEYGRCCSRALLTARYQCATFIALIGSSHHIVRTLALQAQAIAHPVIQGVAIATTTIDEGGDSAVTGETCG